jgi:hypothetical protein
MRHDRKTLEWVIESIENNYPLYYITNEGSSILIENIDLQKSREKQIFGTCGCYTGQIYIGRIHN